MSIGPAGQLSFGLEAPAPFLQRRIDITLERIRDIEESLTEQQRGALSQKDWWIVVVAVSRLRAMERAEEEVCGHALCAIADTYDRVVHPGEHAAEALVRTFNAHHAKPGDSV